MQDFLPKLKRHILWRILNPGYTSIDGENAFFPKDYERINIVKNQFFEHKILRINYTTYDLRRAQDSLNPSNHADLMCLSQNNEENNHPFEYVRLLRLFHIVVTHEVSGGYTIRQLFNIMFVRRYQVDDSYHAGFKHKRLHRVQFRPQNDPQAFGFVDPDDVIRGAHLIPGFRYGPTDALLYGKSIARAPDEDDDWLYFFVNLSVVVQSSIIQKPIADTIYSFVDRDMYMRYRGGGIGHYRVPLPIEDFDNNALLPPEAVDELSSTIEAAEADDNMDDDSGDSSDEEDGLDMTFDNL